MTELEKKNSKAQQDLVQNVLEAFEKANIDRVDALISNAIKQLKMSRYKPDLGIFISLTYLARVNPKIFRTDSITEAFMSLLKRDTVPNIKNKNEIILPVLAANILLASGPTPQIKIFITQRIEQWLTNTKPIDIIQNLLVTLCMKCDGDEETISALIKLKAYWMQYLETQEDVGGLVSQQLCQNIRALFMQEQATTTLIEYLNFLKVNDRDLLGLTQDLSIFIAKKPLTFKVMVDNEYGPSLIRTIMEIFSKYTMMLEKRQSSMLAGMDKIKLEQDIKCSDIVSSSQVDNSGILILLADIDDSKFTKESDFKKLLNFWTKEYCKNNKLDLPLPLRLRLLQSSHQEIVDMSLSDASLSLLMIFLQQFGLPTQTVEKVLGLLDTKCIKEKNIGDIDFKSEDYLKNLITYHRDNGVKFGQVFLQRLEQN